MNIVCVICSDLLIPSDDVFYTPCGHIFHFVCVTQWLERSKTCPQCREKTTSNKIHRLYFNLSNNDIISEDKCSLQDKIDKLNFQLMLKEKDIKHYKEKSATLENQTKGLQNVVRKTEKEVSEKNNAIYALKEQINYLRDQNVGVESKDKEIKELQERIKLYKNVQSLIEDSVEEATEMISRTCDPNTLVVYACAMKREMMSSLIKKKEMRTKVRSLQQSNTTLTAERNSLAHEHTRRIKLEKELAICESEKIFLQNRLQELEKTISLMKKSDKFNSETVNVSNNNSSNSSKEDQIENVASNTNSKKEDIDKEKKSENQSTNAKDETNSPYLPLRSGGVLIMKQYITQKSTSTNFSSSILRKKPRIEQISTRNERVETNTIVYDGFGGHSKIEQFPISSRIKIKKGKVDVNKPKKQKLM